MGQLQLEKKIEYIEQRLLVLEGAYGYHPHMVSARNRHNEKTTTAWSKTYGALPAQRATALVRKMRANRKAWSKTA